MFKAAVQTVVTEKAKTDKDIQSAMSEVLDKLACTGDACKPPATGTGTGGSTSSPIQSVKTVLNEFLTDMRTMFSNDGIVVGSTGAMNQQAYQFKKTGEQTQLDTQMLGLDFDALRVGAQLYLDYQAGRTTSNGRSAAYGNTSWMHSSNFGTYDWHRGYPAVRCSLEDESGNTATSKATAKAVSCFAQHGLKAIGSNSYSGDNTSGETQFTAYGHGFTLTPDIATATTTTPEVAAAVFTYVSSARQHAWKCPDNTSWNCGATITKHTVGVVTDRQGAITLSLPDSKGKRRSMQWEGDLPQNFDNETSDPQVMPNAPYSTLSLSMNPKFNNDNELSTLTFAGVLSSKSPTTTTTTTADRTVHRATLKSGSTLNALDNTGVLHLKFDLFGDSTSQNTARFAGTMTMSEPVTPKNATRKEPTKIVLDGQFSNQASTASSASTFLTGRRELTASNYANFDPGQPDSSSNKFDVALNFTGSAIAPNQPRLELVLATSGPSYGFEDAANPVHLTYNRYAGTTKTRAMTLTVTPSPGASPKTAVLQEASSGLRINYSQDQTEVDVFAAGSSSKIGVLNTRTKMFTFSDGSTMSMEFWP